LEFVSVCVFFHPCYLGFVTSFTNTNLFVNFMEKVWHKNWNVFFWRLIRESLL
jgi:hypothetical protein